MRCMKNSVRLPLTLLLLLVAVLLACKSESTEEPPPQVVADPNSTQVAPASDPLPGGSYAQTCSQCTSVNNVLTCRCLNRGQTAVTTSLTLPCQGELSNQDGQLTCGIKQAAPAPAPPPAPTPAPKPAKRCICAHGKVYGPEPDPNVFNGGCARLGCAANYRCQSSNGNCVCTC